MAKNTASVQLKITTPRYFLFFFKQQRPIKLERTLEITDKKKFIEELNDFFNDIPQRPFELEMLVSHLETAHEAELINILEKNKYICQIQTHSNLLLTEKDQLDSISLRNRRNLAFATRARGLGLLESTFVTLFIRYMVKTPTHFYAAFALQVAFIILPILSFKGSVLSFARQYYLDKCAQSYRTASTATAALYPGQAKALDNGRAATTTKGWLKSWLHYQNYRHPIAFAAGLQLQTEEKYASISLIKP